MLGEPSEAFAEPRHVGSERRRSAAHREQNVRHFRERQVHAQQDRRRHAQAPSEDAEPFQLAETFDVDALDACVQGRRQFLVGLAGTAEISVCGNAGAAG